MEKTDQDLICGYLAGSDQDFSELYDRYKNQLYGYLMKMAPNSKAEVDDLFQKTWIKVMNKLPEYRSSDRFQAWLFRIAHNLAIDLFRSRKRRAECVDLEEMPEQQMPVTQREPGHELGRQEIAAALSGALQQLAPEQREVFLMRQEEVSFKEIAQIQKCSINTALARMQYAIKKLRELLTDIK